MGSQSGVVGAGLAYVVTLVIVKVCDRIYLKTFQHGSQALLRVWRGRRSDYNLTNVIRVSNWH